MTAQSPVAQASAADHLGSARALLRSGQYEAARAAYTRAREAGLGGLAPTLLAEHWGTRIRARDLHEPAAWEPAFGSFLRFMGETPFTPNEWFAFVMEELAELQVEWISRLAENHLGLWPVSKIVPGARCLTMGPLEGALEFRLAGLGAHSVVALEGYLPNYLKCLALKALFPDLPIEFVRADVEAADLPAGFDAIFCPGVLYHLQDPHLLLQNVRALKPRVFFLQTQVAFAPSHPGNAVRKLAEETVVQLEGRAYRGRLFSEERSGHDYLSGLDAQRPSFWFYPEELRQLLLDLGFVLHDEFVIDLQELGMAGLYVCSTPGVQPPIRFRLTLLQRLQRILAKHLMPRLSRDQKLARTSFRG